MVEFCSRCKSSLPRADLTVRGGEIFASHDYECPFCRQIANPLPNAEALPPLPDADHDVSIKAGETRTVEPP